MKRQRGYINLDLDGLMIGMIVVGAALGIVVAALAFWLGPIAWDWLRPMIHQATGAPQ